MSSFSYYELLIGYYFELLFMLLRSLVDMLMMKTREKISGGFGNQGRAKNFCDLRNIISSSLKQDHNILQILTEVIADPLLASYKLTGISE